ncbi:hypothetical protein SERLA73DRAFT_110234 [Serpula lacrymans var. lacrymans S7.3]|uniref:RING-type domain-containing protein n=2 Tax=Serpula lacrymans var. lacrymans TaxID=341189 RepID=F8Q3P0_SERL3|nr:uncharacterized protein SERLADRAFT_450485 [Serpula lacrymans var. lacrymans S7.9]EGN97125.1 hypothetical protein SERLA73DRAFT_110234 [Serpula lacrymans var. lacrymans S7.3]EGO22734.1 hypothetical protein SERLADRAFT_450485 [Serpula lacrymans var. lacrymans S7.9]
MHFSKTYAQLLLTLPPELRDNAIEYRQLKKLINQVVNELSSLGLSPSVLQQLLEHRETARIGNLDDVELDSHTTSDNTHNIFQPLHPHVVYEFATTSTFLEPRLRLSIKHPSSDLHTETEVACPPNVLTTGTAQNGLLADLPSAVSNRILLALSRQFPLESLEQPNGSELTLDSLTNSSQNTHELVIPLISDTAFFRLLTTALQSLSTHLVTVHSDFTTTLQSLSLSISHAARPTSSTSSFHPHSPVSNNTYIYPSSIITPGVKSDLYSWREIFQLYVEAEVFEGIGEINRGERTVEESEKRLRLFSERVSQRGLDSKQKLKLKQSRDALGTFLKLNFFILDLKKFQLANAEATRKILKKHTKRTALPLPAFASNLARWNGPLPPAEHTPSISDLALIPTTSTSLPRLFVQAIGETLLPIVPHIDDYACLICTSIAFKPIRLACGHLFCVRCLVKLQKRGKANCPMCRAPTVLTANRSNVDWALINFMEDWFPVESKAKLKQNEREAAEEEFEELGLRMQSCMVM